MKTNRRSLYEDIGKKSYQQTARQRFFHHRLTCVSLMVLAIIYMATILAPIIAPYDPDAIAGPFGAPPGPGFLLETDQIEWDMLSRLLYTARIFLLMGVLTAIISTAIGVGPGLLKGYFGGWLDIAIIHFTGMVMFSPYTLLVLVAAAIFEPGFWSIILILGSVGWPSIAWLVKGNVLGLRGANSVKSSIMVGMPVRYIPFSETPPNTVVPILVYATSVMASFMLDKAFLSFLGTGVQPPAISLGNMLSSAQSLTMLTKQPWFWISSGLLIAVLMIAINFMGDTLRDALGPSAVPNLGGAEQDAPGQDVAKRDALDSL